MDIFDFLFKLVQHFGLVSGTDWQEMHGDMCNWRTEKIISQRENPEAPMLVKFYNKHGRAWYTRLALALLFIPAVRWFHDYMNPQQAEIDQNG
jgi:hypothetical protein